jgi:hypothetical protein
MLIDWRCSVGPAFAIPKVLIKAGISKDDVDFYEINEVSGSSSSYFAVGRSETLYSKIKKRRECETDIKPTGFCIPGRHVYPAPSPAIRNRQSSRRSHRNGSSFGMYGCKAGCYWIQRGQEREEEDLCDEYVHWEWDGECSRK